jgi:pyruvate dehydrogenase E2 component (dihydrolipoamide acetyltransferase)
MAGSIIMPKTGMAMEEGVIIQWLKKEGDRIEKGDPVVEVETDKSTMEVEADYEGTLLEILRGEGETVPVTEVIGWIGEEGEELPKAAKPAEQASPTKQAEPVPGGQGPETGSAPAAAAAPLSSTGKQAGETAAREPAGSGRIKATPAARRIAGETGVDLGTVRPTGGSGEILSRDVREVTTRPGAESPFGVPSATPLASRIAEKQGISLTGVRGSGPGGKILSKDLRGQVVHSAVPGGPGTTAAQGEDLRVPLTRIQRITGKRMLESHLEIPPVTMSGEADVTELLEIRSRLNREEEASYTINDFVMKAVAMVLVEYPRLNAVFDEDAVIYKGVVNLGMAVATERGLTVPVIRNAAGLSLGGMSEICRGAAESARAGTLGSEEMSGGTFTVSNIGKFGVTSFTPIINPPEAAILGVCAVVERLVRDESGILPRKYMGLSLTFDHRIVDGAEAAEFFAGLVNRLERPLGLMA